MPSLARQRLFATLAVLASVALVYALNRSTTSQPAISLENCQPRDAWAKISRAHDPRAFWIDQHIRLEDIYSRDNLHDVLQDCEIQNRPDENEQEQCRARYNGIWQKATRCLEHAAKMCRFEGGRC